MFSYRVKVDQEKLILYFRNKKTLETFLLYDDIPNCYFEDGQGSKMNRVWP